jgi:hypothetical protein
MESNLMNRWQTRGGRSMDYAKEIDGINYKKV